MYCARWLGTNVCGSRYLGSVGDARKSFSSKPEGRHRPEVAELPELGGRETLAYDW